MDYVTPLSRDKGLAPCHRWCAELRVRFPAAPQNYVIERLLAGRRDSFVAPGRAGGRGLDERPVAFFTLGQLV